MESALVKKATQDHEAPPSRNRNSTAVMKRNAAMANFRQATAPGKAGLACQGSRATTRTMAHTMRPITTASQVLRPPDAGNRPISPRAAPAGGDGLTTILHAGRA